MNEIVLFPTGVRYRADAVVRVHAGGVGRPLVQPDAVRAARARRRHHCCHTLRPAPASCAEQLQGLKCNAEVTLDIIDCFNN